MRGRTGRRIVRRSPRSGGDGLGDHALDVGPELTQPLVDALDGVQICFGLPTRDINTGLDIPQPGCYLLDGTMALAYARSRHYEEFKDGEWKEDPTSDLGRSQRQRDFVNRSLQAAIQQVKSDPFSTGDLVGAMGAAISIDGDLDPIDAASSLRTAVASGLTTYALPVIPKTCLLYTSDAADDLLCVDLGGRRILKKK